MTAADLAEEQNLLIIDYTLGVLARQKVLAIYLTNSWHQ